MKLQFGDPETGLVYKHRPTAFGLVLRHGKLACVRVDRGERSYYDLPGGALDGDETEREALVREFVEETGLSIRPGFRIGEAAQFFRRSNGEPVNNRAGFWTGEVLAEDPSARIEDDHQLHWLEPHDAIGRLRHEAHAWAVCRWLRTAG